MNRGRGLVIKYGKWIEYAIGNNDKYETVIKRYKGKYEYIPKALRDIFRTEMIYPCPYYKIGTWTEYHCKYGEKNEDGSWKKYEPSQFIKSVYHEKPQYLKELEEKGSKSFVTNSWIEIKLSELNKSPFGELKYLERSDNQKKYRWIDNNYKKIEETNKTKFVWVKEIRTIKKESDKYTEHITYEKSDFS